MRKMGLKVVDNTEHRCPSGLRSRTQDAMWQHSRVQIPLCAFFIFKLVFIFLMRSQGSIDVDDETMMIYEE